MNSLLEQFTIEAAELLESLDDALLDLERDPSDADRINEVFRVAHTLKGSAGLFDLPPLIRLTHAAEDLLDAVRGGRPLSGSDVDVLLRTFDIVRGWIDHLCATGSLPDDAAEVCAAAVQPLQLEDVLDVPEQQAGDVHPVALPDWLDRFAPAVLDAAAELGAPLRAVRYQPHPECFFRGEDPVGVVGRLPGLRGFTAVFEGQTPRLDDFDEYRCDLTLLALTTASAEVVEDVLCYVRDECEVVVVAGTGGASRAAAPATPAVPAVADDMADATPHAVTSSVARTPQTLRVDQERVDQLLELVGELLVATNGLPYLARSAQEEHGSRELSRAIKGQHSALDRIARELQDMVMDVRMLPMEVVFRRLPRLVRDLARKLDKEVELDVVGSETTADKAIVDLMGDPLIHLIRNSLDHGLETPEERVAAGKPPTATLRVSAERIGDSVEVLIVDDGRGVDVDRVRARALERGICSAERLAAMSDEEAVHLIFTPGFSTAEAVSDVSGRGVGMDAVRSTITQIGGNISLSSTAGQGTRVRLVMPLSMAVTKVMVVSVAGQRFGVPLDQVHGTLKVPRDGLASLMQQPALTVRGQVVPVLDLAEILLMDHGPTRRQRPPTASLLVLDLAGRLVALEVERFHRDMDVVAKPLEGFLSSHALCSGSALLGDGSVLLVLDVEEVLGRAVAA